MENLKALVYGKELNNYQRSLAIQEFEKLQQSNKDAMGNNNSVITPQQIVDLLEMFCELYDDKFSLTGITDWKSWLVDQIEQYALSKNDDAFRSKEQNERMREWFKKRTGKDIPLNEQMKEVDIILKAQKVLQTFKMEMNVNTTTEQHHNAKLPVMPRFLPQPSDIEKLMKEKLEARKINDEFGWTGEWRMSAKDVLDVIIDLQNGA